LWRRCRGKQPDCKRKLHKDVRFKRHNFLLCLYRTRDVDWPNDALMTRKVRYLTPSVVETQTMPRPCQQSLATASSE
jgi:hypothetical protein